MSHNPFLMIASISNDNYTINCPPVSEACASLVAHSIFLFSNLDTPDELNRQMSEPRTVGSVKLS